jgi:hypothetical protein
MDNPALPIKGQSVTLDKFSSAVQTLSGESESITSPAAPGFSTLRMEHAT